MEDGTELVSLWQTAYGALSDANGKTLTASEYIMLLPTPEDELNQTVSFPGGFTNVTIDYPIQMEAHEHPNVSNSLSFNAVMEDGTDDYYSNIQISFQPISGFDPYMERDSLADYDQKSTGACHHGRQLGEELKIRNNLPSPRRRRHNHPSRHRDRTTGRSRRNTRPSSPNPRRCSPCTRRNRRQYSRPSRRR